MHAREVDTLNDKMKTVMDELRELHRQAESIQLLRSSMEQLQTELNRLRQGRGSESIHELTTAPAPRSIAPDRTSLLTNARYVSGIHHSTYIVIDCVGRPVNLIQPETQGHLGQALYSNTRHHLQVHL